jgi:hypothetical protein
MHGKKYLKVQVSRNRAKRMRLDGLSLEEKKIHGAIRMSAE